MSSVQRKPTVRRSAAKKKNKSGRNVLSPALQIGLVIVLLILLSPLYYGYILRGFTSAFRWVKDIGKDPHYRTYDSFNIPIPGKYKVHGIDVSYYQGKINWKKVAAMQDEDVRIHFAFIKATEGLMRVDPYFRRNWRESAKAGIISGAYHYFKPSKSGKWQARFFLQTVHPEKGDLPLVVDVEELNGVPASKMRIELQAFLSYVETKTGTKPLIYANLKFYEDYLEGYFEGYNLWIAHYYKSKLRVSKTTKWKFWQHSDKATINGINHVTDMNVFNGDSLDLDRLLLH